MLRLRALFLDFLYSDESLFKKLVLLIIYPATLFIILLGGLLFLCTRAKQGSIRITRVYDDPNFTCVTREALALVEKYDPRRYALLQNELRFIDDTPSAEFADYDSFFRRCRINFATLRFDWTNENAPDYAAHRQWYTACYAATLVHEATHGRLYSMGFPYTKRTRLRVERICTREQRRFAANLPQTTYNYARDLVKPFDASRWERYWNMSRWQWAKEQWRRAMKQIHEQDN